MPTDREFMERALALAERGRGRTSPNPMVGCVVVQDGAVVGEGYHECAGDAHAEVNALRHAGDVTGATVYVTLEPCCHEGKTPPCVDLLKERKPARVIGPGDLLHELPDRNMVANNISSAKGARFLVFQVGDIGKPLTVKVE